jgi:hypothetical protein
MDEVVMALSLGETTNGEFSLQRRTASARRRIPVTVVDTVFIL